MPHVQLGDAGERLNRELLGKIIRAFQEQSVVTYALDDDFGRDGEVVKPSGIAGLLVEHSGRAATYYSFPDNADDLRHEYESHFTEEEHPPEGGMLDKPPEFDGTVEEWKALVSSNETEFRLRRLSADLGVPVELGEILFNCRASWPRSWEWINTYGHRCRQYQPGTKDPTFDEVMSTLMELLREGDKAVAKLMALTIDPVPVLEERMTQLEERLSRLEMQQ